MSALPALRLVDPNPWLIAEAKRMREVPTLNEEVRALARQFGLLAYHTHDSRRSAAGFPDWVLVGTRVLFRELKREGEKPTPAQQAFLDRLAAAGADVGVWRPIDLLTHRIHLEMAAVSPIPAYRRAVE